MAETHNRCSDYYANIKNVTGELACPPLGILVILASSPGRSLVSSLFSALATRSSSQLAPSCALIRLITASEDREVELGLSSNSFRAESPVNS